MKSLIQVACGFVLLPMLCLVSSQQPLCYADEAPAVEQLFVHVVQPLLKEKCSTCHGDDSDDVRGNLDTRSLAAMLQGGDSEEPAVIAGDGDSSPLYLAATRTSDSWSAMPPKDNDRLSDTQLQALKAWIDGGAPWPNEARIAEIKETTADKWNVGNGVTVATSGGLSPDWTNRKYDPENLWAYQPLRNDLDLQPSAMEANPIDVLIGQRLNQLELNTAPLADRRTLIRRVTFDLTGLPATAEQVASFINDPLPDDQAFAKVVDRLLKSEHYGERWGQHWLDVVRYADSSGFANDFERGNAWRYRDYVVRSFNSDKPYDHFITEQIAGDEMFDQLIDSGQEPSQQDNELLIAVGFLRMGPWELTGMEVARVARQRFLDDVTDTVGQVFLGHMLQCARCHDHKFDPVPTRDYYSIQSVFATTQLAERSTAFLEVENTDFGDQEKYLQARNQFYARMLKQLDDKLTLDAARQWLKDEDRDPAPFEAAVEELLAKNKPQQVTVQRVRNLMQKQKVDPALIPPRHVGFQPEDFGLERIARKGQQRLQWRFDAFQPYALSVYSGRTPTMKGVYNPLRMPTDRMQDGELEETCILTGGDPFAKGERVSPGVLSVIGRRPKTGGESRSGAEQVSADSSAEPPIAGRRIELAQWIASPDNPLTARVMVNRIWQWHFGKALAGNPNNFGATGRKPTHGDLLDRLAAEFINSGWSVKAIHRLILSSDTYRRSSQHPAPEELAQKDPEATSYAVFQPRRLTAEELRDAMLFVSGELNPTVGGLPVRPEMNLEAALQPRMVMGTFAEAWQPSPLPSERHRRSIYALRIRGQRDPFQEVFNAPSPDLSCEARDASTVTPQVFALFNSEITFDRALAMASRIRKESGSDEDALQRLFQLAYGRSPTNGEVGLCLEHWQRMAERHKQLTFEPPSYPTEVVREAVEENTGEKFRFTEPLEVYKDFVPDLKPCDASPELRGLAEVCLVVLNSSEFVYVY